MDSITIYLLFLFKNKTLHVCHNSVSIEDSTLLIIIVSYIQYNNSFKE